MIRRLRTSFIPAFRPVHRPLGLGWASIFPSGTAPGFIPQARVAQTAFRTEERDFSGLRLPVRPHDPDRSPRGLSPHRCAVPPGAFRRAFSLHRKSIFPHGL